jgi:hypothetical protein
MDPSSLIGWAFGLGLAWLVFATITGADEWLRSLFGTSKASELEKRVKNLEERLVDLEKRK